MAKQSRLGRGLDSLIPAGDSSIDSANIHQIDIELIRPNPHQPRKHFIEEELAELAESIRAHGIIQPLIVRSGQDDQFTLIAGERRLQAAKQAGLAIVPIVQRDADDQELVEIALVENVQRSDLSPLESAEAYRQLHHDFGLAHKEIAKRVGKSRVAVTNTLSLLDLGTKVKQALVDGLISEGHGRALKGLESAKAQSAALQSVIRNELNVRQTEELVRKLLGRKPKSVKKGQLSPEMAGLQDRLRESFGTKVDLKPSANGGRISMHYYSDEELNALIDKLLND
jgi:ParB family chromosome partitioning protein